MPYEHYWHVSVIHGLPPRYSYPKGVTIGVDTGNGMGGLISAGSFLGAEGNSSDAFPYMGPIVRGMEALVSGPGSW